MKAKGLVLSCVATFLMGCSLIPQQGSWSQDKTIVSACQGYAESLVVLARANEQNKLTEAQVDSVDNVVDVVGPLCRKDSIPNRQEVLNTILNNVAKLNRIETNVGVDSDGK